MKSKRPKGVTVLSIFLLISHLSSIKHILNPNAKLIMANHVLDGATVNVYYAITIGVGIAIAIGLWLLKKWGLILFFLNNAFGACLIIFNMALVQKETLLLVGCKNYDGLVGGYRTMQAVALVLLFLLTIWGLAYRRHFNTQILINAEPIK